MRKFIFWLKNKKTKKSRKEKTEMQLEELKAKYAELSDEDKKAFLESVNGGTLEDSGEPTPVTETPVSEEPAVETPTPTPEETPTPEAGDETAKFAERLDSVEQSNKALLEAVEGLKAAIEGLKKDPQPADKDTTDELDKLTNKYTN